MALIILSVIIAVILVRTEFLTKILASARELKFFGNFIAGMFFTSVFTTAPAIVALGEIARVSSILPTAILGAMGAVAGDLIIFRFIRDRFSEHLMELVKHQGAVRRINMLFRLRIFRWLTFLAGGLIIASPFPDELGISLLGFSKMRTLWFILLSFTFNFIGILFIGWVAKAL
ncbi:MAG: hypothetical protein HYV67_00335 [Candidatus Taylorbacteria bacterium]|nr:hypothetical protein [Candidatus Taylorbacteria bacterium]